MAEVDLAPVYDALRKADAAGNKEDAQRLANYIRASSPRAAPAPEKPITASDDDTESYFDIPSLSFKQRPGNFAAAFGGGAERFVRGAGNLAVKGLNKILPSDPSLSDLITGDRRAIKGGFFSDEAVRNQDELDKPLEEQNPVGYGIGEAAPTLPVSGVAGAASKAAKTIPYAGKVLSSALTRMGLEGAVDSAAVADVDEQGKAAAEGAGASLVLRGAMKSLGRVARGIVNKSAAAEDLQHIAGQQGKEMFIPVGQAGDKDADLTSRLTQTLYKSALPLVPGVEGQVEKQSGEAMNTFRELAMNEADPTGAVIRAGAGKEGLETRRELKNAFDQEYKNTVSSYSFNVPSDLRQQVEARVRAALPNVDKTTLAKVQDAIEGEMSRYADGKNVIDGGNLMNTKAGVALRYSEMEGGPEKKALAEGQKVIEDMIDSQLSQGGSAQNLADLAKYKGLADPYKNFKQVGEAIEKAKAERGQFTPEQLAKSSDDPSALLHLATQANEVLGQKAAQPNTTGKVLAYSVGAYGGFTHPVAAAGMIGAGNLLATKMAQKIVMGDTGAQQALQRLIKTNPEMAHKIQTVIRGYAATQVGAKENASP